MIYKNKIPAMLKKSIGFLIIMIMVAVNCYAHCSRCELLMAKATRGIIKQNLSNAEKNIIELPAPDLKGTVRELRSAALGQRLVLNAPVTIVWTAIYSRTTRRYGKRGEIRYVPMDMGGAGQNVHLQAEALGLGTVIIGAFRDEKVQEVLGVKEDPLYIMPVGRKK